MDDGRKSLVALKNTPQGWSLGMKVKILNDLVKESGTMNNPIEIYLLSDGSTNIEVQFEEDTVWLNRKQLSLLFGRDVKTIGKHINNIFKEEELEKKGVIANFATTATDGKTYQVENYNLDVIISVGYRVKSKQGTKFRQWATKRLKDYLVQGYAINKKRLAEKQQQVQVLKNGIRIISRALESSADVLDMSWLKLFSKGLTLLDDYDHESLDVKGTTLKEVAYPDYDEYMEFIQKMHSEFSSAIFAKEKDQSFHSSIKQIQHNFDSVDIYPTIEEKAAMLLYLIVKNHSFVDGNKRIAAACFLYFLQKNNCLLKTDGEAIISNEALAALTLFVAISQAGEMETAKNLIVSVLNRNG